MYSGHFIISSLNINVYKNNRILMVVPKGEVPKQTIT